MKVKQSSIVFGLLAGGVLSSSIAPAAQAGTFTMTARDVVEAECLGSTVCDNVGTDDFFKVTAGSTEDAYKELSGKSVHGVLGLGVSSNGGETVFETGKGVKTDKNHAVKSGDNVDSWGEVDKDEFLKINFDGPGILKQLDLSALYHATLDENGEPEVGEDGKIVRGDFGDRVFEAVKVTANVFGGGVLEGLLKITGDTTATWTTGGDTVQAINLSPSASGGGGSFSVANLFGNSLLTGLNLTPDSEFGRYTIQDSDFTLSKIVVEQTGDVKGVSTSVPEPGTVSALFGLAAAAGLKLRRRPEGDAA
ncbi:PEP-CTERM sorting domain-containing protein [Oscillatoriales cyanobacterium LEGE 11467]|uniref:PEP-CTERM sorting domain-containing protein n=1 Tax=Zarconia navalis LEGE 11467 TaxID=1828826 RepID=A0A928W0M0_9CYAN|nr:PEP-CTERM sorting domain-containing protein [Zarconia navalis]MBE9041105.1 PEP-CTERM sorting domain-containing protein [Zarconia navalis LEGE 11467]